MKKFLCMAMMFCMLLSVSALAENDCRLSDSLNANAVVASSFPEDTAARSYKVSLTADYLQHVSAAFALLDNAFASEDPDPISFSVYDEVYLLEYTRQDTQNSSACLNGVYCLLYFDDLEAKPASTVDYTIVCYDNDLNDGVILDERTQNVLLALSSGFDMQILTDSLSSAVAEAMTTNEIVETVYGGSTMDQSDIYLTAWHDEENNSVEITIELTYNADYPQ